MSILGNLNNLTEDEPQNSRFEVPKVAKNDDESSNLNLKNCIMIISPSLHILSIIFLAVVTFILMLLGVKFSILNPPQNKPQDIEFVLVDKEQMPINKNTKYRADKNSRASGKHNPKKKVSMPSQASKKSPTTNATQQLVKKVAKQQAQQAAKTKPVQKTVTQTPTPKKTQTQTAAPKPTMPSAKPSYAPPSAPKINNTAKAPIGLPAPPSLNTGKSYSTGPVGGSGTRTGSTSTSAGSHGGTLASAGSTGSRAGSGSAGNPGPGGNPNGPWGVDALREPNFAPYMRELQSRIKYNWDPPKGNESKRVVLLFRIAKNGQLLSNKVSKSSGLPAADRAALNAVEVTAPFRPLPAEFKGQYIDIQFTFDYNVFGATGY